MLAALYELVRGFQAADDQAKGELLRDVLAENPNHVYQGLLTVLMRLVFVLYAEDRGLLSSDPIYANYLFGYGLFERCGTTMAGIPTRWISATGPGHNSSRCSGSFTKGAATANSKSRPARLSLRSRPLQLPGRPPMETARRHHDGEVRVPRISDGVIFRVLNNLLILDGERLSYRTLDVEQIGSVYET